MVTMRAAVLLAFATGCLAALIPQTANRSPTTPSETPSEFAASPPQPRDSAAAHELVDYDNSKLLETTPFGLVVVPYFASRGQYDRAVRSFGRSVGSVLALYWLTAGWKSTLDASGILVIATMGLAFVRASLCQHWVEGLMSTLITNPIIRSKCRQPALTLGELAKHPIFGAAGSALASIIVEALGIKSGGAIDWDTATARAFMYTIGYYVTKECLIRNIKAPPPRQPIECRFCDDAECMSN